MIAPCSTSKKTTTRKQRIRDFKDCLKHSKSETLPEYCLFPPISDRKINNCGEVMFLLNLYIHSQINILLERALVDHRRNRMVGVLIVATLWIRMLHFSSNTFCFAQKRDFIICKSNILVLVMFFPVFRYPMIGLFRILLEVLNRN